MRSIHALTFITVAWMKKNPNYAEDKQITYPIDAAQTCQSTTGNRHWKKRNSSDLSLDLNFKFNSMIKSINRVLSKINPLSF